MGRIWSTDLDPNRGFWFSTVRGWIAPLCRVLGLHPTLWEADYQLRVASDNHNNEDFTIFLSKFYFAIARALHVDFIDIETHHWGPRQSVSVEVLCGTCVPCIFGGSGLGEPDEGRNIKEPCPGRCPVNNINESGDFGQIAHRCALDADHPGWHSCLQHPHGPCVMIDAKMWDSKSNKWCDDTRMLKKCAGEVNKRRLSARVLREGEEMNKSSGNELKKMVLLFDRQAATAAEQEKREEAVRSFLESEPKAAASLTGRLWLEMICKDYDKNKVVVGVEARVTAAPVSSGQGLWDGCREEGQRGLPVQPTTRRHCKLQVSTSAWMQQRLAEVAWALQ